MFGTNFVLCMKDLEKRVCWNVDNGTISLTRRGLLKSITFS